MATLTPSPKMQFFTANGVPLSGGKLYTYAAGTGPTIPLATYTDSTGSIPNTNPVILNSRGEASVWLGTSLYYMELKDSTDVLIWSSDNIGGVATLSALAASTGAALIGFIQSGTGAVARTAQSKMRDVVTVKDFGAVGNGVTDDSAAIQAALNAITTGVTLVFPCGLYLCGNYLSIANKDTFAIEMQGIVKPTGALNSITNGLFNFDTCTNFSIKPNIVNAGYTSTINSIRLFTCSNVQIKNGLIDIKYNSFDGTAGIQIAAGTTNVEIAGNYIRASYGVLGNNGSGVSNIHIHDNEIVGQLAYGSIGTGDAVEANFPTAGSSKWYVENNRIHGYRLNNPGGANARVICIGMANVSEFTISNNKFWDSDQESIHVEDGCTNGVISNNIINTGIIGINIVPSGIRDITNIVISGNQIAMPVMPSHAAYTIDYGAAILVNVANSTGITKNITISSNTCSGVTGAARGICVYSVDTGSITGNTVKNFPRAGYDFRKFTGPAGTPTRLTIQNNIADANGWNFIIGGISSAPNEFTNSYFDESNVSTNSLFNLDYNSEITTRTNTIIRIPFANGRATRKLTAGDLVVHSDGSISPVTVSGVAGGWQYSDAIVSFSKTGTGTSNTITITFASYATASVPAVVEITALGVAANGTSHESIVAKFALKHTTAINGAISAFGTNDVFGGPITITPSVSTLSAIFTVAFASGFTHSITARIWQPSIYDSTLGGITSIT